MKYSSIFSALLFLILSNTALAQTVEKPRERMVVVEAETEEEINVPLAIVEVAPIYPGCAPSREESVKCLLEKINEKFNKEFVFPSTLEKTEQRLFVSFNVSKEGVIKIVGIRSQHKEIDEKVRQIFSDLPQLFPGTQRNKPVVVSFSVPFTINKD